MARLWISALFAAVVSTVAVISGAVADAAPLALRAADLTFDPATARPGQQIRATLPAADAFIDGVTTCVAALDGAALAATCTPAGNLTYAVDFVVPTETAAGPHGVTVTVAADSASGTLQVLSPVVVPDLRGLQYPDAARQAARAAGLAVCPVHRTDGIVVDQTPLPGETSTFPNCIEVTVVDAVRVPDLVGATLNDARDRVQSVKLVLAHPATVAGTVASQTPVADTLAAVGTTVTVTMTGPDKVTVPDLLGRTVGDAQALLLDAGLRLRNGGSDRSRRIATQNPPPGAKAARGTRVSVTLQPPVRVVSVPDLRGMTLDQARAALTDAGLVLASLSTDSGHDAHVTAQSPTAGAQVPPGSQVTVTLEVAPPPNSGGLGGELAGGAVVLALAAFGGVALRLRRRAPSWSDPAQSTNRRPLAVQLVPRPDPARDVRVLSSHDLAHARLGLEPHVDPTVDPDLVEVSS